MYLFIFQINQTQNTAFCFFCLSDSKLHFLGMFVLLISCLVPEFGISLKINDGGTVYASAGDKNIAMMMMMINSCFLSFLSKAQWVGGGATRHLVPALQGRAKVDCQTGGEDTAWIWVDPPEGGHHR